ncbi:MAG: VOC family protein [Pseudolabrys sp.]
MDAPNPSAVPTFANRTPIRIGETALAVRDLDRVADYYRVLLGLSEIERSADALRLGAGGVPILTLERRPHFRPDDPRAAGLYHNAFLMPTRLDLARWIVHIIQRRIPISGASDHGVSEAIYLDDPEGNGVEVYSDRPASSWDWRGDMVAMMTEPLDIDAILQERNDKTPAYESAPGGLRVGHIHLHVGDVEQAEAFYCGILGLAVVRRRGGATFMSSGRYHHHVGANTWRSPGAGLRDSDRAGLSWFAFEAEDDRAFDAMAARLKFAQVAIDSHEDALVFADPWGNRIRLVRA